MISAKSPFTEYGRRVREHGARAQSPLSWLTVTALQGQSALPVFLGHFCSRYDPSMNLRGLLIDATLNSESL